MTSTVPIAPSTGMPLSDHPQRRDLNDEVHARPSESLEAPLRISFLALFSPGSARDHEWQHLRALAAGHGTELAETPDNHFSGDFGPFRLKWERHTEFSRYKVIRAGCNASTAFADPALTALPKDWLEGLRGEVLVATHVALLAAGDAAPDHEQLGRHHFAGNPLMGADIAGGAATALTDFRIHDGFSRLLVFNRAMNVRQTGRMVQRLLEIDTYRMLALLALPVARSLAPSLSARERELADITTALADAQKADETALLDRLTRLQAKTESRYADSHYRFAAATAYYDLVQRRIAELRESRIQGLQTFREFTERRLGPAMSTCQAVAARQESMSVRMGRATQLLSTRVDVARQRQNQAVLESMNRRAHIQLRLQETVEGLSIAAITYYVVGLVGYAAKGVKAGGLPLDTDLVVGASIPVVAVVIALGVRRIRKAVTRARPF